MEKKESSNFFCLCHLVGFAVVLTLLPPTLQKCSDPFADAVTCIVQLQLSRTDEEPRLSASFWLILHGSSDGSAVVKPIRTLKLGKFQAGIHVTMRDIELVGLQQQQKKP